MKKAKRIDKLNKQAGKRLRRLLKKVALIRPDREYAESLIVLIEKDGQHNQEFISALELILHQDKVTQRKCRQRMEATSVDIFKGPLADFSAKEIGKIASNMCAIQMTDGCTVGCAWCGLSAQGYITKKISFKSFKRFVSHYGQFFHRRLICYWASDPLEWYEEENSYLDLAKVILKETNVILATVTALPEGTELTALRFLELLSRIFSKNPLSVFNAQGEKRCFEGTISSHDSLFLRSFPKKKQKVDPEQLFEYYLLTQKRPSELKYRFNFSVSKRNIVRIKALFTILLTILQKKKIRKDFLESIFLINKDISSKDIILKTGRAFDRDVNRNEARDLIGIACFDGVLLTPDKLVGMTMTAVTRGTPRGIQEEEINPSQYRIPRFHYIGDYQTISIVGPSHFEINILPLVSYDLYQSSSLLKTYSTRNLEREILAYSLLWDRVVPLLETLFDSLQSCSPTRITRIKEDLRGKIARRERITMKMIQKKKINSQIIKILEKLLLNINDWLSLTG